MECWKTSGNHPNTAEDDYRLKLYAAYDTAISCIQDRFMQDDYEMFSTLEQIVLKVENGKPCEEEAEKVVSIYKDEFDSGILKFN